MRRGGKYAFQRGEFFGNKPGDFTKIRGLDDDHQIVSTACEITGNDLIESRNPSRQAVEATAALRSKLYFDKGGNTGVAGTFTVDHGVVAEDHAALLKRLNLGGDLTFQ